MLWMWCRGSLSGYGKRDTYFEDMPSFRGYLYRAVYHNCLKVLRDRNIKELCLTQCGQERGERRRFRGGDRGRGSSGKLRGVIARMPEKTTGGDACFV